MDACKIFRPRPSQSRKGTFAGLNIGYVQQSVECPHLSSAKIRSWIAEAAACLSLLDIHLDFFRFAVANDNYPDLLALRFLNK
jgi:hypothetical protein